MLVMSACKALGSVAAAEGYVAALPEGLMTVNLSTAGEMLPEKHIAALWFLLVACLKTTHPTCTVCR